MIENRKRERACDLAEARGYKRGVAENAALQARIEQLEIQLETTTEIRNEYGAELRAIGELLGIPWEKIDADSAKRAIDKLMSTTPKKFDIYKGLIVNGFKFRGLSPTDYGFYLEHECGYVIRFGQGCFISEIAATVLNHNCERDNV